MGKLIIGVVIISVMAALSVFAYAQSQDGSVIDQSTQVLIYMRSTVKSMDSELKSARKDKDAKRASCMDSRLSDLQRLLADCEKSGSVLRAAAFEKKTDVIGREYAKITKNQQIFEQQVKLVNECFTGIYLEGGFTESLEMFLGMELPAAEAGIRSVNRVSQPEPRPPEYEPEPVSASE